MSSSPLDHSQQTLADLKSRLQRFIADRDWHPYHSPKNLSMALAVEVSEVMEIFQWLTEQESFELPSAQHAALQDELGDVFLYLLQLADKTHIDLLCAASQKLEKNVLKYPADKVRGSAKKYTEY